MGKPSYPKPPDPWETATAQGSLNQQTAYAQNRLNQVNQVTPYGTLTYQPTGENITYNRFNQDLYDERVALRQRNGMGGVPDVNSRLFNNEVIIGPEYAAVVELTPEGQRLQQGQIDLQQSMMDVGNSQFDRISASLSDPVSFDGLPAMQTNTPGVTLNNGPIVGSFDSSGNVQAQIGADDFGDDRLRVERAMMDRMQPYLDQQRDQRRTQLVNQGFADPGSAGHVRAMDEINRAENDARLGAIVAAGNEQARLFGMDATAGQFANQAQQQEFEQQIQRAAFGNQAQAQRFGQDVSRSQLEFDQAAYQNTLRERAIQERMLQRNAPINEISALTSGTQVQQPNFVNTPQASIQAPDFQGATYASYQGELQAAQAQAQQRAAMIQGLSNLAGAGIGAFGATNGFGFFPSFGGA